MALGLGFFFLLSILNLMRKLEAIWSLLIVSEAKQTFPHALRSQYDETETSVSGPILAFGLRLECPVSHGV